MKDNKSNYQFKDPNEVRKFILDRKNYQGTLCYIKVMINLMVSGIVVVCFMGYIIYLMFGYQSLNNKVKDHFEMVNDEISSREKRIVEAAKWGEQIRETIESVGEDNRLSDMRAKERARVHSLRKEDAMEAFKEENLKKLINALINKEVYQKFSSDLHNQYTNSMTQYNHIKRYIFEFKSNLIADHNLVPRLTEEIATLKTEKPNKDNIRLLSKKEELLNEILTRLEKYNYNASEEELFRIFISEKNEHYIKKLFRELERIIPIFVKHDDSYNIWLYATQMKEMSEYLGIAKDIDWTVPLMVVEELEILEKYKEELRVFFGKVLSEAERKEIKARMRQYIFEMDEKYKALEGNIGLKYPIFAEYRKKYIEEILEVYYSTSR